MYCRVLGAPKNGPGTIDLAGMLMFKAVCNTRLAPRPSAQSVTVETMSRLTTRQLTIYACGRRFANHAHFVNESLRLDASRLNL